MYLFDEGDVAKRDLEVDAGLGVFRILSDEIVSRLTLLLRFSPIEDPGSQVSAKGSMPLTVSADARTLIAILRIPLQLNGSDFEKLE